MAEEEKGKEAQKAGEAKENATKAPTGAKRYGPRKRRRGPPRDDEDVVWKPRTELGQAVKAEKYESLDAVWKQGKKIKEPEIADFFLKDMEERILSIGKGQRPFRWVQRMTDSGRRNKYFVVVAVGNKDGYIGVGIGKAKEYGGAITQGVRKAKLNIIKVERSCGSWDCGCTDQHSVRFESSGKSGSVKVTLKPAPKGTRLATNNITKDIMELTGIKDIWSTTRGHTKTRPNMALATFDALKNLGKVRGK